MDAYIAGFPKPVQARLQALRKTIHKAVPGLTEDIRYQIPTFRWRDTNLVHFAGYAGHVGFYPVLRRDPSLEKALAPYLSGAATAKFPHDGPLPLALVAKLVKHRLAQVVETVQGKGASSKRAESTQAQAKKVQSKKGRMPASTPRSARPKAKSARSSSRE